MKKFYVCLIALAFSFSAKAQYVTIPDANFVAWLQQYYPSCMVGNQMDTSCAQIKNETFVNVFLKQITDLTGIEYFSKLKNLNCSGNQLTFLPMLANSISTLNCALNNITNLTNFPDSLTYLDCSFNHLTFLPMLPNPISTLYCQENDITYLTNLPASLKDFVCAHNLLTNLPAFPDSVINIQCYGNQLTVLPNLPDSLILLWCGANQLTSLPNLPQRIRELNCSSSQITSLPPLPNSLKILSCGYNQITSLPPLPNSLEGLYCSYNQIITLPNLPISLISLSCNNNQLTSLPLLPDSLEDLYCNNNQINNLLNLPHTLKYLFCQNNNISCFPVFPNTITFQGYPYPTTPLNISGNPFTCLPNYIPAMDPGTLAYPLCINADSIYNPNACLSATGVNGFIYKDNNSNCIKDLGDYSMSNISVKLFDSLGNFVAYTNSASNGIYHFSNISGTHTVKIDTLGMPYSAQCTSPGIDSTVNPTIANPLINNVDFEIGCHPGFDVGVHSVVHSGIAFPGLQHYLGIVAGDLSNWNNLHCAAGVSGQIQVTVNGPVTFDSIPFGALIPSVSGNVFTYNISDFGTINNQQAFGLFFTVNTNAQWFDTICVNVVVTPTIGDNNPANNTYYICYQVWNSYDPNMKEVYPINVPVGFNDYFTYTLHFQNTGNAPAINIRLVDTLSNNLDLETFELINYSHYNVTSLEGNVLTVRFPNIQLPDSTTDQEGSKGFVQYHIKPKASWATGDQIKNTAWIYFDYNAPIATNTTINQYDLATGLNENEIISLKIYPNPFNADATVQFNKKVVDAELIIFDMLGQKLKAIDHISGDKVIINRGNISNGIYFIRLIEDNKIIAAGKLIIAG